MPIIIVIAKILIGAILGFMFARIMWVATCGWKGLVKDIRNGHKVEI